MNSKLSYSPFSKGVGLVCFITILGQTPALIDNYETRRFIIPLWLLLAIICVFKNPCIYFGETKSAYKLIVFFSLCYIGVGFFIPAYENSAIPYCLYLSIFILSVGLMAGGFVEKHELEMICTMVIWAGFFVCIDVFYTYILHSSFESRVYVYDSKNSVSQILITSWILIICLKLKLQFGVSKILYLISLALLTVTLIGLKSRATLIAIPLVLMWIIVHGNFDRRLRNAILVILGVVLICLCFYPDIVESIVNNAILGGRNSTDLNDISSGRMSEWQSFWKDFSENPYFGHGRMKRESLILTSLLEFGMIGGGCILCIAVWPFYWAQNYLKKSRDEYYLMFSSLAIAYVSNGVFEQLAPFGPGVKCFFLWFLMGLLVATRR